MMATTHAFVALALVTPLAYQWPELASPLAVGAIVGGIAPDLDIALEHRRSFHFPVAGGFVAVPGVVLALVVPSAPLVALATAVVAAWLHAASDVIGNGPLLDPWAEESDQAVYDHVRGTWLPPLLWIRYDGAPEDAVAATGLAIPPLLVFDGVVAGLVVLGIAVSVTYAMGRRRMVEWAPEWLE